VSDVLEFVLDCRRNGIPVVLATVIRTTGSVPAEPGKKMAIAADGTTSGTVGGGILEAETVSAAREAIREGAGKLVSFKLDSEEAGGLGMLCGGAQDVYLDLLAAPASLLILGGGHVGMALGRLAAAAGLAYCVADDRAEFVAPERFPAAAQRLVVDFEQPWDGVPVGPETFIVIMTRGHSYDRDCLRRALATPARYIGMIGSRKKARAIVEELDKEGLGASSDPRLYTPIGLPLGTDAPEDIAVSILAEIFAVRSGGKVNHMRDEPAPAPQKKKP